MVRKWWTLNSSCRKAPRKHEEEQHIKKQNKQTKKKQHCMYPCVVVTLRIKRHLFNEGVK